MDFAPVIHAVLNLLWLVIPLAVLAAIVKSPWFKGWVGETLVNLYAGLFLDRQTYHLIRNVTLPTADGTTQIDHIIVSRYGVFVVETKNMKGWIYGSARQPQWTQKIYRHTRKFQNPLHQNHKHVKTLQTLLGLADTQVHSLVVFVGDCTFKTVMPGNVTRGRRFVRFIKDRQEKVLTDDEVASIVARIAAGRLDATWQTHREHARHVAERVEEKTNTVRCPNCQGAMVQRVAKRGAGSGSAFWGCMAFPRCRGVVRLQAE